MRSTPIPPEGRPTDDTRESVCRLRWERRGPSAREFAQKSSLSESSRDHLVAKEIILHQCPTSFSRPLKGVDTAAVHDDNILIGEALSDSRARNTDFSRAGRAAVSFTKTRVVFFQLEITTTVSSERREANDFHLARYKSVGSHSSPVRAHATSEQRELGSPWATLVHFCGQGGLGAVLVLLLP